MVLEYNDNPFDKNKSLGTCEDEEFIPLEAKGTKIGFKSRVPTMEELNSIPKTYRVHLSSAHPWNPSTVQLSNLESETYSFTPNIPKREQVLLLQFPMIVIKYY